MIMRAKLKTIIPVLGLSLVLSTPTQADQPIAPTWQQPLLLAEANNPRPSPEQRRQVRDRVEDRFDRREDRFDRREDRRDAREDVRDRREDIIDRRTFTGPGDIREDRRDRLEDRYDRREDRFDRREDRRDAREDVRDARN